MEFYWFDSPTVSGLARALETTSKAVIEYAKLDEFEEIITDAILFTGVRYYSYT